MVKIGLTGGIGSGKSAVAAIWKILGIPVFDVDHEAKIIMEENESLISSIKNKFGNESYVNGRLNRAYLAAIVFGNPAKLELLNSLVHPATIAAANSWIQSQAAPYVIKEAALMFEAGSAGDLDYIVGVYAPQHLRIHRVMERDSISREQVLQRMKNQISEVVKMKLCDFVVVNDEQQLLIPQVLQLHQKFLSLV